MPSLPLPIVPDGVDPQDYILTLISPFDDARSMLLKAIESATTSIYLADYSFNMPDLVDALIAKASAGLRVVIVLDHTQSGGTSEKPLVMKLVEAARNTPLLSVVIATSPTHGAIMHLKVAVIDDALTIDGSFNYSGRDKDSGAQAEANDMNLVPSRKRAALFKGRIIWLHDWALTHEQRYQIIPPEAGIAAATTPPEVGVGKVERAPDVDNKAPKS